MLKEHANLLEPPDLFLFLITTSHLLCCVDSEVHRVVMPPPGQSLFAFSSSILSKCVNSTYQVLDFFAKKLKETHPTKIEGPNEPGSYQIQRRWCGCGAMHVPDQLGQSKLPLDVGLSLKRGLVRILT